MAEGWRSGSGLCCVGSSIGLMLMLVVLGVMSITWMSVIAVVAVAQKLLPAKAAIDVPLALAIIGLGVLIVTAPSSVPRARNSSSLDEASRSSCATIWRTSAPVCPEIFSMIVTAATRIVRA